MPAPTFPVETIAVRPWPDPVVEAVGHDPRSAYVEQFWLGVLGPSSTWLLRRLAAGLDDAPDGFDLELGATAQSLGLGMRGGKNSPFMRSIGRCCQFGLARHFDERTLMVRRTVPPLSSRQLDRLPESLRAAHGTWATPADDQRTDHREHARRLACTLLELGEPADAAEAQLHRWRIHPALAHEAIAWAAATIAARADHPASSARPAAAAESTASEGRSGAAPAGTASRAATRRIPPPPTYVARPTSS